MTNRFLMSVAAAALIAGTGFANAQGTGTSREPSGGSSTQQNAPSEQTKSPSGMKSSQSDEKAAPGAKSQRAQDDMKSGAKGEKSAQDNNMKGEKSAQDNNMKGEKSKSMSSENDKSKAGKDMKAEGREGQKSNMNAQTREGQKSNMNAEQKGAADSKSQTTTGQSKQTGQTGQSTQSQTGQTTPQSQTGQTTTQSQTGTSVQSQTTGQAGAAAKLSTEQRTKITTVIRDQHVQPLNNVNFSISVGTRVPRDVRFHPLPREVVTIYPEWRGYEFVLVHEQIVVIDPRTFEIVAILEA
jgi:hypothetical protein